MPHRATSPEEHPAAHRAAREPEATPRAEVSAPDWMLQEGARVPARGAALNVRALQRQVGNQAVLRMLDAHQAGTVPALTGMSEPVQAAAERQSVNHTGLPKGLKAGVEELSGLGMDDVRVHYNSPEPARVNALAYAQGNQIHLISGQEHHLPHEAWHVVQQKQGRVKATLKLGGTAINDDTGLEHEAEVMGQRAVRNVNGSVQRQHSIAAFTTQPPKDIVQRARTEPEAEAELNTEPNLVWPFEIDAKANIPFPSDLHTLFEKEKEARIEVLDHLLTYLITNKMFTKPLQVENNGLEEEKKTGSEPIQEIDDNMFTKPSQDENSIPEEEKTTKGEPIQEEEGTSALGKDVRDIIKLKYDPKSDEGYRGATVAQPPVGNGYETVDVYVYSGAFDSPSTLYSVLRHELIHVAQYAKWPADEKTRTTNSDPYMYVYSKDHITDAILTSQREDASEVMQEQDPEVQESVTIVTDLQSALQEIETHVWELKHAKDIGVDSNYNNETLHYLGDYVKKLASSVSNLKEDAYLSKYEHWKGYIDQAITLIKGLSNNLASEQFNQVYVEQLFSSMDVLEKAVNNKNKVKKSQSAKKKKKVNSKVNGGVTKKIAKWEIQDKPIPLIEKKDDQEKRSRPSRVAAEKRMG